MHPCRVCKWCSSLAFLNRLGEVRTCLDWCAGSEGKWQRFAFWGTISICILISWLALRNEVLGLPMACTNQLVFPDFNSSSSWTVCSAGMQSFSFSFVAAPLGPATFFRHHRSPLLRASKQRLCTSEQDSNCRAQG